MSRICFVRGAPSCAGNSARRWSHSGDISVQLPRGLRQAAPHGLLPEGQWVHGIGEDMAANDGWDAEREVQASSLNVNFRLPGKRNYLETPPTSDITESSS